MTGSPRADRRAADERAGRGRVDARGAAVRAVHGRVDARVGRAVAVETLERAAVTAARRAVAAGAAIGVDPTVARHADVRVVLRVPAVVVRRAGADAGRSAV